MMRRWGIRYKVLLVSLLPTLGITLLLGAFFTHHWIDSINRLLIERGTSLSRQLASAAEYGTFSGNRSLLQNLTNTLLEERDVMAISLFDAKGNELAHTGPRHDIALVRSLLKSVRGVQTAESKESSLYVAPIYIQDLMLESLSEFEVRPMHDPGLPLGWAVVEMSHTNTEKERYKALLLSLLLMLTGLALSGIIGFQLGRSITQPIFKLNQAVSRLKEGQLETRVFTGAGPELEQLESGLNAMAEALNQAQAELQQSVEQATEDLRQTLEAIEIQNIELDMARKDALEASRTKSEFLANMSHEIRTPLNGIIGFTDLLLKTQITAQQQDHLSTIRKSSEILLTIINDILDFSKIEAGKLVLDRIPFHLRDIIDDVMAMLAPTAHAKNLDLVALIYNDVPDNLIGDPLRLKQVITNLLNNAIKFTQTGEVVLRAMLDDDDESNRVSIRISVTDTGVGLSRAQQQGLFNAFSQADASTARHYGGTGLGLVISRRLIEEMGGQIGLESELGKGSTFWFTLKSEVALNAPATSPPPGLRRERIIYFESQRTTGLAVENLLRDWDVDLTRTSNLPDLLELVTDAQLQQRGFAVAVIGLNQAQLHSGQYRDGIQQLEEVLDCRTLLLSPTPDDIQLPILSLASAHLNKPVNRSRLYDVLYLLAHGESPVTNPRREVARVRKMPDHGSPRILAVDDNEANLKLVLALLDSLNIAADAASCGFDALTHVHQQRYDLIFMDVQMPGMDGLEATQRIREQERAGERTPIVALTAHALTDERERLLRSGFDDYLTKPVNELQLAEVITRRTGFRTGLQAKTSLTPLPPQILPSRPSTRRRAATAVEIGESIRLAAGKKALAEELFRMLLDNLPDDRQSIRSLHAQGEHILLLERVHKLHGATRYCGVPELRQCAEKLETGLKRQTGDIDPLVQHLIEAMDKVSRWCESHDWEAQFRDHASA